MIPMTTMLRLRKAADKAGIPEFHEAIELLTELSAQDAEKPATWSVPTRPST